jgi:hypothetical protein
VQATRLQRRVSGVIFAQVFSGKTGLRLVNQRAVYAIVSRIEDDSIKSVTHLQDFQEMNGEKIECFENLKR